MTSRRRGVSSGSEPLVSSTSTTTARERADQNRIAFTRISPQTLHYSEQCDEFVLKHRQELSARHGQSFILLFCLSTGYYYAYVLTNIIYIIFVVL